MNLPQEVVYVAWLDCDVAFTEHSWAEAAVEALQRACLVQLFENLIDLDPGETLPTGVIEYTGKSMAAFLSNGGPRTKEFPLGSAKRYRPSQPGLAWAGRRSLLERHGFYDRLILGGGDGAFALAAYGRFDEIPLINKMNDTQKEHYLPWARSFFDDVQGSVSFLKGDLLHYWHGNLADRRYDERHEGLSQFGFNPDVDIKIDSEGCFVWSSDKPSLHEYVRNYWSLRQEDGPAS